MKSAQMDEFLDWFILFGGHFGGFNGFNLFYWNLFSATTDKSWKKYHFRYFQKKKISVFNLTDDLIIFGSLGAFNKRQGHLEILHIVFIYFNFNNQVCILNQTLFETIITRKGCFYSLSESYWSYWWLFLKVE